MVSPHLCSFHKRKGELSVLSSAWITDKEKAERVVLDSCQALSVFSLPGSHSCDQQHVKEQSQCGSFQSTTSNQICEHDYKSKDLRPSDGFWMWFYLPSQAPSPISCQCTHCIQVKPWDKSLVLPPTGVVWLGSPVAQRVRPADGRGGPSPPEWKTADIMHISLGRATAGSSPSTKNTVCPNRIKEAYRWKLLLYFLFSLQED